MGGAIAKAGLSALLIGSACLFAWSQRSGDATACGDYGPYDFDTYEADKFIADYNKAIEVASVGQAVTGSYSLSAGDVIDVTYQGVESGPRASRTTTLSTAKRLPPAVFKSIAWIETVWNHASSSVPYGGVGPVIRSFDCGYGLGQITTGMSNNGASGKTAAAAAIGATSLQVNGASAFLPGDGVSLKATGAQAEDNTVSYVSGNTVLLTQPLRMAHPAGALLFTQGGRPSGRQAAIGAHPAFNLAEGARILADKWNSAPEYRPIAGNGDPLALEDWYFAIWAYNGFAFKNHPLNPFLDSLRGSLYHCYDPAAPGVSKYGYADYTYPERVYGCMRYPPIKNGVRLWPAQVFSMPDLEAETGAPEVIAAFKASNFTECEDRDWAAGCPKMDYPTTVPAKNIVTHPDTTVVDPNAGAGFLGAPVLSVVGATSTTIIVPATGQPRSAQLVVKNTGTWLAPYRVRVSSPWLLVRHPGDPVTRTLDGGVAVGAEVEVVLTSSPRTTQQGYDSTLLITVDPETYPGGLRSGKVIIEPLYGSGAVFEMDVTVLGTGLSPNRAIVAGTTRAK